MKKIYYIGFYFDDVSKRSVDAYKNLAGTMKMNFLISCLKELGYGVEVLSICIDKKTGWHPIETIVIDDKETHVFLPYYSIGVFGKVKGGALSSFFSLKKYLKKRLSSDSTVIVYHSLFYKKLISSLHKRIGFNWIHEIEELYAFRKISGDSNKVKAETALFSNANSYIFVNDLLPKLYSKNKPYTVAYGNYTYYGSRLDNRGKDTIDVVYTGLISKERGVFDLVDAFALLPSNYRLDILGFGEQENMSELFSKIEEINGEARMKKILFCGTKSGKEYDDFLFSHQIGVSLIDTTDENIMINSFPSKILAYLGHSLEVVSTRCESIEQSRVSNMLFFCDNNPEDISHAIIEALNGPKKDIRKELHEMKEDFKSDLNRLIERY